MKIFGIIWRFTGVNSRFLSDGHKCKYPKMGKNCRFSSLPRHSGMQTSRRFQSRIIGWQNTIFGFLEAQLDFLAIFFNEP